MSGWTEQIKPERDRSLLWHWIWCESGKPGSGVVYDIMRRAEHSYVVVVRLSVHVHFNMGLSPRDS